jgi:hypothetical protein
VKYVSFQVQRPGAEELFAFPEEELSWWDEPSPASAPASRPPARPDRARRRPSSRTLAGDLARLQSALVRRAERIPLPVLLAVVGVLVVLLLLTLRASDSERQIAATPKPKASARTQAARAAVSLPKLEILRTGDEGEAVRGVQAALVALGYAGPGPDGLFGEGTRSAVLAFQRDRGLAADGVVGGLTAQALTAALLAEARTEAGRMQQGLVAATAAARLSAASEARYRGILEASLARLERLSASRGAYVLFALREIALHADAYDEQRALTLFSMLEANVEHLAKHGVPATPVDIEGEDGVVYRLLSGHGYQFHPIANFARLNSLAARKRREDARRLATSLVERAVPVAKGLIWEYYFPFGGPPRWTSGFAQAVASQALARTGALLDDQTLLEQAKAAYRAIPNALLLELAGGAWIREYGFSDMPILNAQLQSLVSLREYVEITDDAQARATATAMEQATRALIPRFDTGCWSLYALGGNNASVSYHEYHVSLLKHLGRKTGDRLWSETGSRWEAFLRAGPCG